MCLFFASTQKSSNGSQSNISPSPEKSDRDLPGNFGDVESSHRDNEPENGQSASAKKAIGSSKETKDVGDQTRTKKRQHTWRGSGWRPQYAAWFFRSKPSGDGTDFRLVQNSMQEGTR
jgi:hypothetical protein